MRSYETAMNQYNSLQGWLAHYNQILRSRPRVSTRHKDTFSIKNNKYEKSIDSERRIQNDILINKLMEIRQRPRKSVDDSTFYKPSLKNEFREKQKIDQLQKSNKKFHDKLQAVKSSINHIEANKQRQYKRRQRFSQTLHYQGQVYKTFTDFLRSDNHPRMYLRSQKESISKRPKQKSPVFKVQIVQVCEQSNRHVKPKNKKKMKKKIKRKSIGSAMIENVGEKSDQTQLLDINDEESSSSKV